MKKQKFNSIEKAIIDDFRLEEYDSKTKSSWIDFRNRAIHNLKHFPFNDFLNWDIIRLTMFVNRASFIGHEVKDLMNSEHKTRFLKVLSEDIWGNPSPSTYDGSTSDNRIHHCYLIQKYETHAKFNVNSLDHIFEFGGGYGSLCRIIHKLGFNGKYIIFDLDVFSCIQFNYLRKFGYNIFINETKSSGDGIYLFFDFKSLNTFIKEIVPNLFIGTWSLSEADLETRSKIIPILNNSDHAFLAFQESFDGINNKEFFSKVDLLKSINPIALDHMGTNQWLYAK